MCGGSSCSRSPDCRRHSLRNRCQNQGQVTDVKRVKRAIADWEELYSQYLDAGGSDMVFEDRRGQLLRILPTALRREVFRNMQSLKSLDEIKEWIRVQLELEDQWETVDAGRRRGGVQVNNLEGMDEDGQATEDTFLPEPPGARARARQTWRRS